MELALVEGNAEATGLTAGASDSRGVVRGVDREAGKVKLKHGPIPKLDMPGMTMVFRVRSPELLKGIKVGDAVKFHAEYVDGVFIVTALQAAP